MYAWELRWLDIAPDTHVFDIALVEAQIEQIVRDEAEGEHARQRIVIAIDELVRRTYGEWAGSWIWAASSGGPVRPYCCANHSILPDREHDPGPTIQRIRDSLVDLRAFVEELGTLFADVHAKYLPPAVAVERAAPSIYHLVTIRTAWEDGWYGTFERALSWFAETVVYDPQQAQILVDEIVGGHFESWTAPSPDTRTTVFSEVAHQLAALERGPQIDGLGAWLAIRPQAFAAMPATPTRRPVTGDGHERYIVTSDDARDTDRSVRMITALELCRDAARHDLPLAFDLLAEWQAIVLGEPRPVELRTADAFGKRGRERYPFDPTLGARVEAALAEANDRATPVAVRAARVYLDICFFHPFPDGNARAARLALDHVLSREGLALHEVRGIFTLSRAAGDARGAWSLAAAIDRLAGPRQPMRQ